MQAVNTALKQRGIITWFDGERMAGQVVDQMCRGIDQSALVGVAITKRYMEKVYGENQNDNCKIEFNYARAEKSADGMLAIPMVCFS